MTTKRWRMVVSDLGGATVQAEHTVEADNWMSALRKGRSELGESGGVPTGSSCAVAPDGKVTILDPMAQRRFVLTQASSESYVPPKPKGPQIPSDDVPRASSPAPAAPASSPPAPASSPPSPVAASPAAATKKRAPRKTMAYIPPQPEAAAAAPTGGAKKQAKKTMAYIPASALPKQEVAVGGDAAETEPAEPKPAEAESAEAEPAEAEPAEPEPPEAEPPEAEPAEVGAGFAPAGTDAKAADSAAEEAPELPDAGTEAGVAWRLHLSRDADPSPENPLRYRERTYVVPAGTDAEIAEKIALDRLAELRASLSGQPPGQFINVAVFDHAWEGRPERPPVVTALFKDWQGDVVLDHPLAQVASAQVAAAEAAPAQAASTAAAPAPPPAEPAAASPRRRTTTDDHDARLADAFEACQDLFFLQSPAEGLDFVVALFDQLLPAEAISACLYDIDADVFRFVVVTGEGSSERQGHAVGSSVGLFAAASQLVGTVLRVDDLTSDPRFDADVEGRPGLEARAALYVPLNHQGRLLGMVQLFNRTPHGAFSQPDADLAVYVGRQLSEFLHNARIRPAD
ncbi:MAG TPA: GAF domain-containing protein [Polyangiaceae bacterium LLY-WYZ-15_(1-7)]|nr:GAF domain-containing protein [Polyangiaceae bacterium LLY-WYZ-15_(1-7)]HJL08236.1 GAF domain-containing protein [Polyangiaceae bacterium LLY-WYZ-15_(1-7)]